MEQSNVIDTNILAVANGYANHVTDTCVFASQKLLYDIIKDTGRVSIDNGEEIFKEYKGYANLKGQPGVGDAFIKWLLNNWGNENRCEQVEINPSDNDDIRYTEIPSNLEGIDHFDKADHKFLAVAFGSQYNIEIHEAADTDDWNVLPQKMMKNNDLFISINHVCAF